VRANKCLAFRHDYRAHHVWMDVAKVRVLACFVKGVAERLALYKNVRVKSAFVGSCGVYRRVVVHPRYLISDLDLNRIWTVNCFGRCLRFSRHRREQASASGNGWCFQGGSASTSCTRSSRKSSTRGWILARKTRGNHSHLKPA
jgi:hypothetical protein